MIVDVGDLTGLSKEVVDAEGLTMTPGFVDVHTHYDGQATWDRDLLPSAAHGVTTAVLGSCGVGFAPCRAADRERLIQLFEGVEDIPGSALTEGIRWAWESFPQYLDELASRSRTMDVAAMITHDALRIFVMGERALAGSAPTDEDLGAMARGVREAMAAGAVGLSTGRTDNHRAIDGSATPASEAAERELAVLGAAVGESGRGVLQVVSDFDIERGPERFDGEWAVVERFAESAGGRPLFLSWMQRERDPTQWARMGERAHDANRRGIPIRLLAAPRGIGVLLGLEATFHPFVAHPSYRGIAHLDLAERVAVMRDPSFQERLLGERPEPIAGEQSSVPPLVDRLLAQIDRVAFRIFPLGTSPDYEPPIEASIGARALRAGRPALRALLDAMLDEEGKALLYFPVFNYAEGNLDVVGRMLHDPLALPSLGDGGAHCGTICDASMPTFFLGHWARDRVAGRFSAERAVALLTAESARAFGFHDRGLVAPGYRADLNLLDWDRLGLVAPRAVRDLPAGGRRFLQDARGIRATFVAGVRVSEEGRLTGERPGRVVRLGAKG